MSAYLVTREGQNLGSFELSQIQEGLKTGSLLSTDWGWCEGMTGWQGLAEIVAAAPAPKTKGISSPLSAPLKKGTGLKNDSLNPYAAPASSLEATGSSGVVPLDVLKELTCTRSWVRFISTVMWIGCGFFLLFMLSNLMFGAAIAKAGGTQAGVAYMIGTTLGCGLMAVLMIYPTLKLSKYASNITRLVESRSFSDLSAALTEQRRFWKFYGILLTINLSIVALFFLLVVAGAGFGSLSR